jgi:hypothetical protein
LEDLYEGNYQDRRVMIYQLDFTLKTYFYGKVHDKPMITFSSINLSPSTKYGSNVQFDTVTISTNSISNTTCNVNINSLFRDDIFGDF